MNVFSSFTREQWDRLREEFVRNNLRRVSIRWPGAAEAKKRARVGRRINLKTNRLAWHSRCASCKGEYAERDLVSDHKDPVVPVDRNYALRAYGPENLGMLLMRLLPYPDGYQQLCDRCHDEKTAAEQADRARLRAASKKAKEQA